jgi:hypothetical protein
MLIYRPAYFDIRERMSGVRSFMSELSLTSPLSYGLAEIYFDYALYYAAPCHPYYVFGRYCAEITLVTQDSVELACYLIMNDEEEQIKVCFGKFLCVQLTHR